MSDIKTWIERCDGHPDHQSGMPILQPLELTAPLKWCEPPCPTTPRNNDPAWFSACFPACRSISCSAASIAPLHPQTTWALELLVEFDQARRAALEGKP